MNQTKIYIPDAENVWVRAVMLKSISSNEIEVRIEDESFSGGNRIRVIPVNHSGSGESYPLQNLESPSNGIEDMCNLNYLHEPGILDNLRLRYFSQLPYTYVGDTCIAVRFTFPAIGINKTIDLTLNTFQVNPYQQLPLYTDDLK